MHRSRAERFDDLVLQAVARLEPRWETQLAAVEFGVEEIPPGEPGDHEFDPVPLARLDMGPPADGGAASREAPAPWDAAPGAGGRRPPPRIVVYRRPLLARAEDEEELSDLIFDVVVEEFALLLGVEPEEVDPDYTGEE